MASTFNAFESLLGASEQAPNTKKKSKSRSKAARSAAPATEAQVESSAKPSLNAVKDAQSAKAPATVFPVVEAVAKLEEAARTAIATSDQVKLWGSWCRQAGDVKPVYQDASGQSVSFKQMFLSSKALEITAELAVSLPPSHQLEDQLHRLFTTFLPVDSREAGYLTAAVSKLAHLLADGAPDSIGAAQRAVIDVVRHFKAGSATPSSGHSTDHAGAWLQQLKKLDAGIHSELTLLQKLTQASGEAVTKERVQCAVNVLKLQEEKVRLLEPGSVPNVQSNAGPGNPAVVALQELHSAVYNHLQEAEALEASARSHAAYAEVQLAQSHAAMQREELVLSKQAAELASQIASLEAQLQGLRMQAAEVDRRRAQLKKQVTVALGNGAAGLHAQSAKSTADYKQQLAAVDALLDLVDPHGQGAISVEQILEAQAGQSAAVAQYIDFAQQCLNMNLSLLADIPQKINFSKQRISQAEKLLFLTAANSKGQNVNTKQKDDAEKMLADTMKTAEGVLVESDSILKDVIARHRAMAAVDPAVAVSLVPQVALAEELYGKVGQQYTNVMACYDQAPLKPAPRAPRQRRANEAAAAASNPDLPTPAPVAGPIQLSQKPVATIASASIRQWARPEPATASTDEDTSLPTPAEAFHTPEPSDGFHTVAGGRRSRNKA